MYRRKQGFAIPESHFTDGLTEFDETAERSFEMSWTAEGLQAVIQSFKTLYEDLERIAEHCRSTGSDSRDDVCIEVKSEAYKWLKGDLFDDKVIWRAERVCILMTLRAPEIILRHEAQRLIEVLALTHFAKREISK